MNNSEKLLSKLKDQEVKPIPKWRFTMKGLVIGLAFLISIILGGLAFSIILFSVQQMGFDLITHMAHSGTEFLLGMLPFLWLILLLVFLVLGIVSIRYSKRGYKFSSTRLMLINVTFSIIFGTLFFVGGGANWFENVFAVNMANYESVNDKKLEMWMRPDQGYLAGTILKANEVSIELIDFNNNEWVIDYEQAEYPPSILFEEGEQIKLIGKLISAGNFKADGVRRWGNSRRFQKRQNGKNKNR